MKQIFKNNFIKWTDATQQASSTEKKLNLINNRIFNKPYNIYSVSSE